MIQKTCDPSPGSGTVGIKEPGNPWASLEDAIHPLVRLGQRTCV